jgi:predicted O-linked N-acetylglucosamine transferase (SPINDLY family)
MRRGAAVLPVAITRVGPDVKALPPAPTPAPDDAQLARLTALHRSGQPEAALELARTLVEAYPENPLALNIRGASARSLGHFDEAETCFARLEQLQPGFAGAPYNLALALEDQGRTQKAIAAYQRALAIDPALAQAHNNLGILFNRSSEIDKALDHLERARDLRPDMPEVHNSLGTVLRRAGRTKDAMAAFAKAVSLRPDFPGALFNLGVSEEECGDPERAIECFRQVLAMAPGHELARAHLAARLAWHCDWDALAPQMDLVRKLGVETAGVPPWPLLAVEDAPARQLARSRSWAKRRFGPAAPVPARPAARPDRLRIGYYSADYHDHPGSRLIAGLICSHDRARFEAHAFSYGPKKSDAWRQRMEGIFDHFHDVESWPSERIVALSHEIGIDVAIDRQGYTTDSRTDLFQNRLAGVQVEFLGYPSTSGAEFIDYAIMDPVVAPQATRAHFSEKLIRLPHSYMSTDNTLPIASKSFTRAELGLPEEGFVFCCFNATYKITPREFDIWMRLLASVEGSVLWLYRSNPFAEANLREQARRRGVDPARLVFAPRMPNPEHLARHACADLFLDTFCMNAHTTTVDALWAGLPVLTRQGEQFAARVASSLLRAVGLDDLVTGSDSEYEALALGLAQDPDRLAAVRRKLAANRKTAPLFDTALYTRHFEAGIEAAYTRFLEGLAPADIAVAPLTMPA